MALRPATAVSHELGVFRCFGCQADRQVTALTDDVVGEHAPIVRKVAAVINGKVYNIWDHDECYSRALEPLLLYGGQGDPSRADYGALAGWLTMGPDDARRMLHAALYWDLFDQARGELRKRGRCTRYQLAMAAGLTTGSASRLIRATA
jgi:hypothetical protein